MAENSLSALYRALYNKIGAVGALPVGVKIYPDSVPPKAIKPYLLYFYMAGGDHPTPRRGGADYTVGVKVVSLDMAQAMTIAATVAALLNNKGKQETVTGYLDAAPDWVIIVATQSVAIHINESFSDTQQYIYHEGNQYKFLMERL